MPDADYAELAAALLGDLAAVPWQRRYQVPTATVASTWRKALGCEPPERLRDLTLAGIDAEHRERDYRAVMVGDPRPAPPRAAAGTRARPSRCSWTRRWTTTRTCSPATASGSWIGTSPAR
ncbi:MAG: hypothetical protein ACRDOK_10335 [Streptosporangiaceae bacterium]